LAGATAVEIVLDIGGLERNLRRTAVNHATDRGAVALAKGGDPEQMAEGIVGHKVSPAGSLVARTGGSGQSARRNRACGAAAVRLFRPTRGGARSGRLLRRVSLAEHHRLRVTFNRQYRSFRPPVVLGVASQETGFGRCAGTVVNGKAL